MCCPIPRRSPRLVSQGPRRSHRLQGLDPVNIATTEEPRRKKARMATAPKRKAGSAAASLPSTTEPCRKKARTSSSVDTASQIKLDATDVLEKMYASGELDTKSMDSAYSCFCSGLEYTSKRLKNTVYEAAFSSDQPLNLQSCSFEAFQGIYTEFCNQKPEIRQGSNTPPIAKLGRVKSPMVKSCKKQAAIKPRRSPRLSKHRKKQALSTMKPRRSPRGGTKSTMQKPKPPKKGERQSPRTHHHNWVPKVHHFSKEKMDRTVISGIERAMLCQKGGRYCGAAKYVESQSGKKGYMWAPLKRNVQGRLLGPILPVDYEVEESQLFGNPVTDQCMNHKDDYDVQLNVLKGQKEVWVCPPHTETNLAEFRIGKAELYPAKLDPFVQAANKNNRAKMKSQGWRKVVLKPGKGLLLPQGYYHCVLSKAGTIGVSTFVRVKGGIFNKLS